MKKATQIFYGGTIITMDAQCPYVEALAECNGIIIATGKLDALLGLKDANTRMVNLDNTVMLPGFYDAHSHFLRAGLYGSFHINLQPYPIGTVHCIADILGKIQEATKNTQEGEWISCYGYDDTALAEQGHITKQELDAVSPRHPIYLRHISGHLAIANSCAFIAAGITAATPKPEGGRFGHDEHGELNGLVEGGPAMSQFLAAVPEPSQEEWRQAMRFATASYTSKGVTTAQDGGVTTPIYHALMDGYKQGLLKNRLQLLPRLGSIDLSLFSTTRPGTNLTSDGMLSLGAVKLFYDGSLQAYTAYLTAPYHTTRKGLADDWCGYPTLDKAYIKDTLASLHADGWQVAVHGNGDAAIEDIIEAVECAHTQSPRSDARHIIMHCQTVREDQLDRIAKAGIIPSFFPAHIYYWGDRHRDLFLGKERAERLNPLRSALNKSIRFTMHNDTFVTPINPLQLVWTAVNRLTSSGKCLGTTQRIPVLEALYSITAWAAYQFNEEGMKGSLEAGKLADMVILDTNPLNTPVENIVNIKVLATIVAGEIVFGSL